MQTLFPTVILFGPSGEPFTDDLQLQLETHGFKVLRTADRASPGEATATIVVFPENENSVAPTHGHNLLVVALGAVELPPCLAGFRCPADPASRLAAATTWLLQILDRREVAFSTAVSPSVESAFWSRKLELASDDIRRAAAAIFPLKAGAITACAIAIAPDVVIAPVQGSPTDTCTLTLPQGDVTVVPAGAANGVVAFRLPATVSSFIPLSVEAPLDPAIAVVRIEADLTPRLAPGWLTGGMDRDLTHDVLEARQGSAIISLENGSLAGLQMLTSRGAIPAARIRASLPAGLLVEKPAQQPQSGSLEAIADSADSLERRQPASEYADRNGYSADFLGIRVPLPKTTADVVMLKYRNFSVALHRKRQLAMYGAVNIDGKRVVDEHRSGDPWQLDPRIPDDLQIGRSYYEGTPLDRGHMVRRVDPVWGKRFKEAELDTFHYPNSCPQHKNLNRKTWNDLEDYIYVHLKDDKQKVTVFTGPVLANDDPVFHGKKLPKEFWKVVVVRRPDGPLSATAYMLSQQDMIMGVEFVFGEFRTYQVTVASIEKLTGLDFAELRRHDPKAKKKGLEAAEAAAEVRGPEDLDLGMSDMGTAVNITRPSIWMDPSIGETQFKSALNTFDWKTVEESAAALIAQLGEDPSQFDEPFARRILGGLQNKRRFITMSRVGDAFIQAGFSSPHIQRRYAQALIESGLFQAASLVLKAILADPLAPPYEQEEAQGLLGRISKQIYVNAKAPRNPANAGHLQNAVTGYWLTYAQNPAENFWHGINVVACLERAKRDGLNLRAPADPSKLAAEILLNIRQREAGSRTGELAAWELATRLESLIALDQFDDARRCAQAYALAKDADAFEIGSTLRQLEQVWGLTDDSEPGSSLLPILRAGHLERIGGMLQLSAASVKKELQKVFGSDASQSLAWYQLGLRRAASVARVEVNGKGFGTCWLIDAGRVIGNGTARRLMVTNAHVMAPDAANRFAGAVRPEDAVVHFQIHGMKTTAAKIVFHSPVNELDAVFFEVDALPEGIEPLDVDPAVIEVSDPPQRLYIIGHPGGRDLEFSLQDNHLLAANTRLVHYRTPSEGGSSGSPVFGPSDWKVVALHHAGSRQMVKLDGSGTYEANEGIALTALRRGVRL